MQGYLFGYAYDGSQMGRVFYGLDGPLTEAKILEIEADLEGEGMKNVCVMFVTKIDGDIIPAR
jgi:hypothetical protein